MKNSSGYQFRINPLNLPDINGSVLTEWLENQRRIAIELKAPSGECELLFEVIKKVKEMQDKYYKQTVECS